MQAKIITDGNIYKVLVKKFPWLWWSDLLPSYDSWKEAKEAAFRVFSVVVEE